MGVRIISLSIRPKEVLEQLMGEVDGDLLHSEYHPIDQEKGFGYVVYEYIHRKENCPNVLMVHTENIDGTTHATILSSPNRTDWAYPFVWEDDDERMDKIMEILDEYILDIRDE
ncbi:hypothetical protein [Thermotalea metallivorans]|uniref:Uncharacterized protein n=1 Tax=Thermotalea metallivorans TaxID=520762 RepID=A0A140L6C7_9FIRM|nr:hypothetical protein [Thermotalea metallivorans]KXG76102.1 hypothetical protein AN619_10590 [Thermotalea metallivorans]